MSFAPPRVPTPGPLVSAASSAESEFAYHVFSGSGTNLVQFAGAYEMVAPHKKPKGFAGSSGGGLIALSLASGMPIANVQQMLSTFLTMGVAKLLDPVSPLDVLDGRVKTLGQTGLFKGMRIRSFLGDVFGQKKLKDLHYPCKVTVGCLWTRTTKVITEETHPNVLIADLARCTMSIPLFFKPARLEPDNARTYIDGGTALNFIVNTFDNDTMVPTYGYNIVNQGSGETGVIPVRDPVTELSAIVNILRDGAEDTVSMKKDTRICNIITTENGLDFDFTASDIHRRLDEGRRFGANFVRECLTTKM